jgi:excisionase family DNA binding protein
MIQYGLIMADERNWLTTAEAAAYLRVHQETIRGWARSGAIPAAKLGNRGGFRFLREDLNRFIENHRRVDAGTSTTG